MNQNDNSEEILPLHPASSAEARLEEVENALNENAAHTTDLSSKFNEDLDKIRTNRENESFDIIAE